MPDRKKDNFHTFAYRTSLFKGRIDLYYCYLKSEKLASALAAIMRSGDLPASAVLEELRTKAARMPSEVVRYAERKTPQSAVLALLFEVLPHLAFAAAEGLLHEQNVELLREEYEELARRIAAAPDAAFVGLPDLALPELPAPAAYPIPIKDIKGHYSASDRRPADVTMKGHSIRSESILKVINDNKRVSIKDISKVVRDCSEKTIQREITSLMRQGLVRKEGERRWSVYLPA